MNRITRYLLAQIGRQFFQFHQTLGFWAHTYPRFLSFALNFTWTGAFVGWLARKSTGVPSRFVNSTSVSFLTVLCASNSTLCFAILLPLFPQLGVRVNRYFTPIYVDAGG